MDLVELREARNAGSADATSLLVVIDGLTEAVLLQRGENGGSEAFAAVTPTEYLVAAATALEGADRSHATQLLRVVSLAVPGAHRTVVRLPRLANAVMRALDAAAGGEEDGAGADEVLCRGLEALGLLLGAQERGAAAWSSPSTLRPLQLLLVHYADGRTAVRRAAHAAITNVVKEQRHPGVPAAGSGRSKGKPPRNAASHVAEFCVAELAAPAGAADNTQALRLLQLIRAVAPLLPAARALELCLACARQKGGAAVTAAAMHAVSAIAQSPVGCLGAEELLAAARALLAAAPPHTDVAAAAAFCQAAASVAAALAAADRPAAAALLPETAAVLVALCESPAAVVQRGACAALNLAFQSTVDEAMVAAAAAAAGKKEGPLERTLQVFAGLMQFRYQAAWPVALPLLGRLFLHLRADALPLLAPLLRSLADLRTALVNTAAGNTSAAGNGNTSAAPAAVAAIDEAVGFAIEGCGPERFLAALPLHAAAAGSGGGRKSAAAAAAAAAAAPLPAEGRAWLLPLLRERARLCPCRLSYFHGQLLPLARAADATSRAASSGGGGGGGGAAHAVAAGRWVVQIWQLLPAWCTMPADVAAAFGALAPLVAKALQDTRYPELLVAASAGLAALADGARERSAAAPAAEGPAAELEAVRRTTPKYLPILVEVTAGAGGVKQHLWQPLSPERGRAAAEAITALAAVAPPAFVSSLCKKLVHRLLQATEAAAPAKPAASATAVAGGAAESMEVDGNASAAAAIEVEDDVEAAVVDGAAATEAVALLEVLAALVPSLDETCASLVYRAARPLVRDDGDAALQKHAYRALLALCGSHGAWLAAEERLQDTLELFTGSLLTCHVSARQVRLRCLSKLVSGLPRGSAAASAAATAIIGEVVLCLKDSNARAREGAHLLLLTAAEAATPPVVAKTVVAALGARTPHMRSAAALALAALQQRFGHHRSPARDPDYVELTPQLISTSLLLCSEPSKEVLRAALAFLRVAVGGASREQLEPLLGDIAQAVTAAPPPAIRKSCRAQVKVVLGKLCRKFGFAAVAGLVPDADVKLVEHMRKTAEREVRLKTTRRAASAAAKASGGSSSGRQDNDGGEAAAARVKTLRAFDSATGENDAEADNAAGGGRKRSRAAATAGGRMRVRERLDGGEVVDLLAGGMMERLGVQDSDDDNSGDDGSDLEVGNDGRLIIPDVGDDSDDSSDSDDSDDEEDNGGARGTKRSRGGPAAAAAAKAAKKENGILHVAKRQRREREAAGAAAAPAAKKRATAAPGADFRSRKAGGDVRRKGQKFEPFAYIPLDGRALNTKKGGNGRRGGGEALGQMAAVVGTGGNSGGGGGSGGSGGRRGHKPRGRH